MAIMTAFVEGEGQVDVQQPVVSQEQQAVESKSSIDQSIYGNLLKNPTLRITDNQLTDWSIRPTRW